MDGLEWRRPKWSAPVRAWLYANERLGCWLANHLIADHPEIKAHLATRVSEEKVTVIPYGADRVDNADPGYLQRYGLIPHRYAIVIARPEPENSLWEMVSAFSRKRRGIQLVILGHYDPARNPYHKAVMEAPGPEVKFIGAVYEKPAVQALRFFARLYVHGHQVGGTNPSLVEALGAGSPVLAHDNKFNRWVAGPGARYFHDEESCAGLLDDLLANEAQLQTMREASLKRFEEQFTWDKVLADYEALLTYWLAYADRSHAVLME
jgi:glycosyltransferase involved in cell wall biosynthesis